MIRISQEFIFYETNLLFFSKAIRNTDTNNKINTTEILQILKNDIIQMALTYTLARDIFQGKNMLIGK